MKLLKLNLGCGPDIKEDFINIDILNNQRMPDMVHDLNNGIPFNDGVVGEILAKHFLEHLDPARFHNFVGEMWRVCSDKAIIKIIVPIGKGWQRWPEHRIPFEDGSEEFFQILNINGKPLFKVQNKEIVGEGITEELRFELEVQK